MKSIKYLVMLACMTLGLATVAKAQVYNNEVMFFQEVQEEYSIQIVRIDGNKFYHWPTIKGTVAKGLQKSENYYDDFPSRIGPEWMRTHPFRYDEEMTTSQRFVYRDYNDYGQPLNNFMAISKDLSSLIRFRIINGEVREKKYYIRVPQEDLLPKNTNFDFLNE